MRLETLVYITTFYADAVALEISVCAGIALFSAVSRLTGAFFLAALNDTNRSVTVAEVFGIAAFAVSTRIELVFALIAAGFVCRVIHSAFLRCRAGLDCAVFFALAVKIAFCITFGTFIAPSSCRMTCGNTCAFDCITLFPASVIVARIGITGQIWHA